MDRSLPNDPVIVGALRSPIGKYAGALASVRPDDLLALILQQCIARNRIEPREIDEIVIGCANQAGEDNRNIARMSLLLAGLPETISAITLNRLCASGLDAIIDAARRIITKEAHLVIAGGVESMSRAPIVMAKSASAYKLGAPEVFDSSLGWRFFNDKMRERTPPEHNGVTAERLAEQYKISRQRQDEFALLSHKKAIMAHEQGFFAREIVPIAIKNSIVDRDEGPRLDTTLEKLAALKAAFVENGTVTAGNSSTLNDGASVVIIASREYAQAHGLTCLARIIGFASAGVDPRVMGIGPVAACGKLMRQTSLAMNDFKAIEINEAFAAQVLAVSDELKLDETKINLHGGAIALGHPLGCSGARIVTTLVNHLCSTGDDLGLATLCVGVGQGVSMAIERC